MTPQQKQTAQAIVNIFETGRVAGDYGSVTLLKGDSGHLTYGRSQTTLGSGNLFLLIKQYCEHPEAQHAVELRPYLERLAKRDLDLDHDVVLRETLREAGEDPAMRAVQDRFFDAHYFSPACTAAHTHHIDTPLGQTVVYDSFVHGGYKKVAARVGTPIGGAGGVDERTWIGRYVDERRKWLLSLKAPLPKTVYRMDAFASLISNDAWDLPLPLKVRGVTIADDNLTAPTAVVRATAADSDDPPAPPILYLTTPYQRGADVKLVQEALNGRSFANGRDGVFGPFTEALVKMFQRAQGLVVDGVVGPATRRALGL